MKSKLVNREKIISLFQDGQIIAVGGQADHGAPGRLLDCLVDSGVKHLTTISLDTGDANRSVGKLIHHHMVDKMIVAYARVNPECIAQYRCGQLEIELIPMGSLVERMRCGGMGLGGVLTKTGLGTIVEEGKQKVTVNGETFLLETALRADISLTLARKADPLGNLIYHGTGHNSNPIFATAADISIVEADYLCDVDEMDSDAVKTPFAFIDYILER